MTDKLISIIDNINYVAPTINEFIASGFEKDTAIELRKMFMLPLKNEDVDSSLLLVENFKKHVDYSSLQVFGFYFSDFIESEVGFIIGYGNNNDYIVINKQGEIVMIDYYSGDLMYYLAPSFQNFLAVVKILTQYDAKSMLMKLDKNVKQETIRLLKQELDKKYLSYYISSIPK